MAGSCGLVGVCAGVRLIDDDEFWSGAKEFVPSAVRFYEVDRDHGEGVMVEDGLAVMTGASEPVGRRSQDEFRIEVEVTSELRLPLAREMGRGKDGETVDFATIKHLPEDEEGFHRLADADVVCDEEADRVLFESHQEGDYLVRPGLDRYLGQGTERPGPGAGTHAERVPKKAA